MTLNIIRAGEIFGEIALLDGKPRSADATAMRTGADGGRRKQFLPFLLRNPPLVDRMLMVLCDRMRSTSQCSRRSRCSTCRRGWRG